MSNRSQAAIRLFLLRTAVPLALIAICPPATIVLWNTNVELDGSLAAFWQTGVRDGFFATVYAIWRPMLFGSPDAWTALAVFLVLQIVLMQVVPGTTISGPRTSKGFVPSYRDNGFACFIITVAAFVVGAYGLGLFSPTFVYDHFGGILGALNVFAALLCVVLVIKGRFRPSSGDSETTRNWLFDYFRGTEVYPRVFGFDIKRLVTCRIGMMAWAVIVMSFAAKQHELHGLSDSMLVSAALQFVYVGKFFLWERGYLHSTDIAHDRAGFYIVWGTVVWVPALYTSPALYLVHHPHHLGPVVAIALFSIGAMMIAVSYMADVQRLRVRETMGQCTIWRRPPLLIVARYRTAGGEERENLLLASGWWGLSRHFHYLPEMSAALCWTLPALFDHVLPYFYVIFLSALLAHRVARLERRCREKYGDDWEDYRRRVPHALLPGLW